MHAKILKSENFLDSRRMCWTKQNTERLDQAFGVGYDRDAMLLNQGHLLPAISPLSIKSLPPVASWAAGGLCGGEMLNGSQPRSRKPVEFALVPFRADGRLNLCLIFHEHLTLP